MAIFIDKRRNRDAVGTGNRKKFLDRCKSRIREVIRDAIKNDKIKDITKKDREVRVKGDGLSEPTFNNDPSTGNPTHVGIGNKKFKRGDEKYLPEDEGSGSSAGNDEGDLEFVLTKREFIDILFEEMALPNYVKESLTADQRFKWEFAGVTTDGPITKLHLLRTMLQAFARRFATKETYAERGKKPPFITDEDLRYKIYEKNPLPIKKAVMFAIMDVSGSMGDHERALAKRFFLLLYLFLHKHYKEVDIRFIVHTTDATELEEEDFFNVEGYGGTQVQSAMELTNKIIDEEYSTEAVNIYISQVSDGDDWAKEGELAGYIEKNLIDKIQYFAYLQTTNREQTLLRQAYVLGGSASSAIKELGGLYREYKKHLVPKYQHFNIGTAESVEEVFPVLQRLFKKGKE